MGAGRWQGSGGFRSKFGLSASETLRVLAELKARGMEDCFRCLHFHLGSQISNIRMIKLALNEAARIYVDLARHGAGLQYLDVGGGLGIDYDGSQTNFESSVNYTLQEYANDVVFHIQSVCDDAKVPHPNILSESGRAIVAYHSVLIFNVLGTVGQGENNVPTELPESTEQPLWDLLETYKDLAQRNMLEAYHDAQQALDMAMQLFGGGYMPLEQRSQAENFFWAICHKISRLLRQAEEVPEELGRARRPAGRDLFLQFLALPIDSRQLGREAAFPDHAHPSPGRAAHAPCRAGRHHLRFGRQGGAFHRPSRRQADAAVAHLRRPALLPRRRSWSAPTRRSWATCTIFSATRTPCTSAPTRKGTS